MDRPKHTPGPICADRDAGGELALWTPSGDNLLHGGSALDMEEREENAERLAACWNACDGIADPSAVPDLLAAARAALRCPGIDTTDQETGETFGELLRVAIAKSMGLRFARPEGRS